ncbi:MAG: hypothetical protein D6706_07010 [Chloroflexi bacterium]|nr:MAG: hypothetical protein D6706_07010 [Chloroflexota bacterium]
MTKWCEIQHVESGQLLIPRARWCDTFATKLRGFTWRRALSQDEGLVLVEKEAGRLNTAIHMLFVFFDLAVIWVNEVNEVVDTVLARSWRLSYVPREPARYVIEGHPALLARVQPGDHVRFIMEGEGKDVV